jgi:hypothetical protein
VVCQTCQTENPEGVRDCRVCSNPLSRPAVVDPGATQAIESATPPDWRDSRANDLTAFIGRSAGTKVGATQDSFRSFFSLGSLDLEPGSDFGPRYRIESLLGQGGMGKVYRAHDREIDRTVALKLVRPEFAMDTMSMARFRQELLLASKVSHRNILRIHDLGDVEGVKFISMAFVDGYDLHDAITKGGRLPFDRALHIARQLCSALEAAHAEGVVHRDLKPRNILLDNSDHVFVSDFGLAKSVEAHAAAMTRTGDMLGTPLYMSPEQIEAKDVDHRSDLYSLGLIFHEMVTGDIPFGGKSSLQVMHARMSSTPKNPKDIVPDLPDYFARVIAKCLVKDPANRYQHASEILHDLEGGVAPKRSLRERLPKPSRTWAAVAAALVLAVGGTLAAPKIREKLFAGAGGTQAAEPTYYMAILPFKPLDDSPELKYQAEGIVDALNA